jgi:hypothetical protein
MGKKLFDYVIGNESDVLGQNRKNLVFMRVSGYRSLIFLPLGVRQNDKRTKHLTIRNPARQRLDANLAG